MRKKCPWRLQDTKTKTNHRKQEEAADYCGWVAIILRIWKRGIMMSSGYGEAGTDEERVNR